MNLLGLITLPYVRKHLLRSILTTAGIVLGVALLVAMQTADQSVLKAFNRTVMRIAGKAQLQITAGDTGFEEDVLERVQAVPEVAAAAPVIESSADTDVKGQGRLLILGVDMTGDRSLRDYDFDSGQEDVVDDPLVFIAQPDSLIITREFADRNGLHSGDKVSFTTMVGRKQFTVRGILKAGGMSQAFGGNFGIMDIYAAQKVFGRGRRFDRIDIGLREGVKLEDGEAALRKELGAGFTVEPPSGRGRQFESLLSVYTLAISISSLFALFIGMFIIYNSFAIAVTQRRSEIGILRALGATRSQIRTLFLAESGIAGLIGSAVGLGIGLLAAGKLARVTGTMMESMFGVANDTQDVIVNPAFLLGALVLGVATSMLAALIPARNASHVEPIQALQKGRYQVLSAGENRLRRYVAIGLAALAGLCLLASKVRPIFFVGALSTILSGLLLTPFLALELAKALRFPLKWLRPVEGALAADSLIQSPRRTSATVAALMLSLALVIGQAGVVRASLKAIDAWVTGTLNPDLFVSTSESFASRSFHFPPSMRSELVAIPGVAEVQCVRTSRVEHHGLPIMIVAVELDQVGRRVHHNVAAGDERTMYQMAAEGKGVILAENLALLEKLRVGDQFEIPTPTGELKLPIVGVIRDLSNQLGTVFMDRRTFIRYYRDDSVDVFRVYLRKGASPEATRRAIVERIGSERRFFVMLNPEVREYINKLMDQWFGLTYMQVIVAALVAVLGIVNTLTVSIADRRRELGVLRAVGGLRSQIRGTVWLEALSIGAIGLILGLVLGAGYLYYSVEAVREDLTGVALAYTYPVKIASMLIPLILGAALASSILPAETAVRTSLVEALEYE